MKLTQFFRLLPILLTVSACSEQQVEPSEPVVRPVKLFTVGEQNDEMMRTFPAEVIANQGSYLAFRVNGELQAFPALAGQHVQKGELLAKLDPEDFKLQYDDRKARFELAQAQLGRVKALNDKGIASQAELDQAIANHQVAESALRTAKTNLDYTELRAPFDGIVAKVYVKNFESVQAKQNILRLETRDLMDVVIQVPEKLAARVDKDTRYQPQVVFDAYPGKKYTLTLKEWDTQADPATLTYKVAFSLPVPSEFNLLAGMTGQVYIDLSKILMSQTAYQLVPVEAVFSDQHQGIGAGNNFVWVFDETTGTVHKQAVEVGALHQNGIEVLSGLAAGERIVAAGVHYLNEGAKVRSWQKERGL